MNELNADNIIERAGFLFGELERNETYPVIFQSKAEINKLASNQVKALCIVLVDEINKILKKNENPNIFDKFCPP